MRALVFFIGVSVATSSCLISADNFGGKFCKTNADCPKIAGYLCASSTNWPQRGCTEGEESCICEVLFPPEPGGISIDGGMPVVPDAGPPPDYCTEIKPILDINCLGTCHSAQMGYPNSPLDFRLDYWEPGPQHRLPDGGVGLPGVKAKIDRIKARIYDDRTMPPADFIITPSTAERALVNRWVVKFGGPLGDGGCTVPDAGMMTMDGGGVVDGGATVSFSTQVLPIFQGNCGCHRNGNTSGTLNLNDGTAYTGLVNAAVSAGCAGGQAAIRMRVLPNQPAQSQLWLKLSNHPDKCGNFMPRNAAQPLSMIDAGTFDLVTRWIQQGARNN